MSENNIDIEKIKQNRKAVAKYQKDLFQIAIRFNKQELQIENACKKYMSDNNLKTTTFAKKAITDFLKREGYLTDEDTQADG